MSRPTTLTGAWHEAVVCVSDLDRWSAALEQLFGWQVEVRGAVDRRLLAAWRLPAATLAEEAVLSRGELGGFAPHEYEGLLARAFDDLAQSRAQLAQRVSQIRASSGDISVAAAAINDGNDSLHEQGAALTRSIAGAVSTLESLTAGVRRSAENASKVSGLAAEARDAAVRGGSLPARRPAAGEY